MRDTVDGGNLAPPYVAPTMVITVLGEYQVVQDFRHPPSLPLLREHMESPVLSALLEFA